MTNLEKVIKLKIVKKIIVREQKKDEDRIYGKLTPYKVWILLRRIYLIKCLTERGGYCTILSFVKYKHNKNCRGYKPCSYSINLTDLASTIFLLLLLCLPLVIETIGDIIF